MRLVAGGGAIRDAGHLLLELVETWYTMDYHRAAWPAPVRVLRHLPSVRSQSKIGHFRVAAERAATATGLGDA